MSSALLQEIGALCGEDAAPVVDETGAGDVTKVLEEIDRSSHELIGRSQSGGPAPRDRTRSGDDDAPTAHVPEAAPDSAVATTASSEPGSPPAAPPSFDDLDDLDAVYEAPDDVIAHAGQAPEATLPEAAPTPAGMHSDAAPGPSAPSDPPAPSDPSPTAAEEPAVFDESLLDEVELVDPVEVIGIAINQIRSPRRSTDPPSEPDRAATPAGAEPQDTAGEPENAAGEPTPAAADAGRETHEPDPGDDPGYSSLRKLDDALAGDVENLLRGSFDTVSAVLDQADAGSGAEPGSEPLPDRDGEPSGAAAAPDEDEPDPESVPLPTRAGSEPPEPAPEGAAEEGGIAPDADEDLPELVPFEPEATESEEGSDNGDHDGVEPLLVMVLMTLSLPLRKIPRGVRPMVDWLALSLLFWVPVVWVIVLFLIDG